MHLIDRVSAVVLSVAALTAVGQTVSAFGAVETTTPVSVAMTGFSTTEAVTATTGTNDMALQHGLGTAIGVFVQSVIPAIPAAQVGPLCAKAIATVVSSVTSEARAVEGAAPNPQDVVAAVKATAKTAPLKVEVNPKIAQYIDFYARGRGRRTMQTGLERSAALRERAETIFSEEGVPSNLVWLAQVESCWTDKATSPVGACGVWQMMPKTGERFGLCDSEMTTDDRRDFDKSTRAAAKYLRILAKHYDGNWPLAIGAYNCGEGNMDKAVEKAGVADFWAIEQQGLLPDETAAYVPRVLAASVIGPNPSAFGLS